jgi:hypothetical protein
MCTQNANYYCHYRVAHVLWAPRSHHDPFGQTTVKPRCCAWLWAWPQCISSEDKADPGSKTKINGCRKVSTNTLSGWLLYQTGVVEIADESLKYNANPEAVKEKEAQNIFKHLKQDDYLILLDERGQHKTSLEFSGFC